MSEMKVLLLALPSPQRTLGTLPASTKESMIGLLHLVKNKASKYFEVDANFEAAKSNHTAIDPSIINQDMEVEEDSFLGLKSVRIIGCQEAHWKAGHKLKCKEFKLNSSQKARSNFGFKPSGGEIKSFSSIALAPACGVSNSKPIKKPGKVLFPYKEFIKLFNSDKPGFSPCGLLNCGNSCFANVVLQCLTYTRPFVAYLLNRRHQTECRPSQSTLPFSPINILSRLPNIGGNLGYGRQEDAHEFMRFAIDTMQSVCLDEFGEEKVVEPASQETTIIQHIFGGRLQSQTKSGFMEKICTNVKAWKRLTIQRAPNVLTIALKRFQKGRYGKLNKRVTFPEMMSEGGDGTDVYKLYAVVVHVDMLNASFFGHYICYTKDFHGNWHRIDDNKVSKPLSLQKEQQSIVKVDLDSYTKNPAEHLSPIKLMEPHNFELSFSMSPSLAIGEEKIKPQMKRQDEVTNFKDKKQNKIPLINGSIAEGLKGDYHE
uniref:USP domain-containing protein n=1 Tax=Salix viminalis TaxID=40686 RepID=A0A6N2N4G8_SALVM